MPNQALYTSQLCATGGLLAASSPELQDLEHSVHLVPCQEEDRDGRVQGQGPCCSLVLALGRRLWDLRTRAAVMAGTEGGSAFAVRGPARLASLKGQEGRACLAARSCKTEAPPSL